MNDADDKKISDNLTPVSRRIVSSAVDIMAESPPLIEYQHGLFCQIALPRSKPAGREFVREYRNGSIQIRAGSLWDGSGWIPQPLPYGPKARLVLIHLNSEAVKTRNPEIYCEASGRKFMERLGLNTDGGRDYNLFKTQMKAFATCSMSLGYRTVEGNPVTLDTKPIRRFEAWMENAEGQQAVIWPGVITLSREYFEDLLRHAVPLDARALQGLAHSAIALDAYSFFARRLHVLEKPLKVSWQQFHSQFGQEYIGDDAVRNFRKEWIPAARAALTVYPSAKVEQVTGGLMLYPSPPPVHSTSVAVSHGLAAKVRASLPPPSEDARNLKPLTIEQFRALYPGLDPYACKMDFDAWLGRKAPEQQPRHYDRAFLGFAKKWGQDRT